MGLYGSTEKETSSPVYLQDIIVYSELLPCRLGPIRSYAAGEYLIERLIPSEAKKEKEFDRLYNSIETLMGIASKIHQDENCIDGEIKADKVNHITRLVTNEFMFFTQKPLSLDEFEQLQNKITAFASKQPENLHLLLSSFAVKLAYEPEDVVMNTAVYVTCGKNPTMQFIVKNNTAFIDPIYEEDGNSLFSARIDDTALDVSLSINNNDTPFSYFNLVDCTTLGGTPFTTIVDMCLDYEKDVGLNNLERKLAEDPASIHTLKISRLLSANSYNIKRPPLYGPITQADPRHTTTEECKQGAEEVARAKIQLPFGPPINYVVTKPMPCCEINPPKQTLLETEPIRNDRREPILFDSPHKMQTDDKLKVDETHTPGKTFKSK